jgi:16S rRNA (cytosine1402-N4)-methyltransferase
MTYHVPVMAEAVAENLVADPSGAYLDATAGGGGHSSCIMSRLAPAGQLLALDRDGDALVAARERLAQFGDRVVYRRAAFADIGACCQGTRFAALSGVLFDLGVSSHQLDEPQRGFSFRAEGPLDMRMDPQESCSAATWLQEVTEEELRQAIWSYGEERKGRRIARAIVSRREEQELQTTADLREAVLSTRPQMPSKTLARVFQAVRISVNDELGQLDRALDAAIELLTGSGRLVVVAYHSLEDRLVKQKLAELVRGCVCPPRVPVCVCGREPRFERVLRRPLRASASEVLDNPRARSAVLRVYRKL